MKELRFAVIGCGLMGREFASAAARWLHLSNMQVRPVIVAACDTNTSLLGWFEEHVPSLKFSTSNCHELLERDDVDAVYCAVPHNLHEDFYTAIIRAGKHLLGEKPFGMNQAQNTQIMRAIAAQPGVLVRCSSEFPFFPAAQRIYSLAKAGAFGRIIEVEAGFHHASDLDPQKPINWKRLVAVNGEYGVMGDLGFHVCHLPLRLGWRPKNVRALLSKIVTQRPDANGQLVPCETWDNAHLLNAVEVDSEEHGVYEFPMMLSTKRIAPSEANTWFIRVMGTALSAEFSTKRPKTLRTLPYSSGQTQAWHEQDIGYEAPYATITGGIFEFGFTDAILQMWAAFCEEAVGITPRFQCGTPLETAASHKLFTAALESQQRQAVVKLEWADQGVTHA